MHLAVAALSHNVPKCTYCSALNRELKRELNKAHLCYIYSEPIFIYSELYLCFRAL
jgi:hypothetical protein